MTNGKRDVQSPRQIAAKCALRVFEDAAGKITDEELAEIRRVWPRDRTARRRIPDANLNRR